MNENPSNIKKRLDTNLSFNEFPGTDYQTWKTEVERLLKGAPFDKKMKPRTYEEIELEPIYRREDLDQLTFKNTLPGLPPFTRSANLLGYSVKSWDIAQKLPYPTTGQINEALVKDIKNGQTAISLKLDKASRRFVDPDNAESGEVGRNGTSIASIVDIEKLLSDIDVKKIPVHIQTGTSALPLASIVFGYLKKNNQDFSDLTGSLKADPIGELAALGELPIGIDTAFNEMSSLTKWVSKNKIDIKTIAVDASVYHNSGGSAIEELAYSLAVGVEYLREMEKQNISIEDTAKQMVFNYSIGSNFFIEIAKLRAARMLWSKIIHDCGGNEQAQKMTIHSKTSFYNKSSYDPYVNLLRATTEAFSAVAGGCDSLHVGFFDDTFKQPDEFSRRIARNIQTILKEESHFDKIIDPAGGSWYIENLTNQLAQKAWQHFQEIEEAGGIVEALKSGLPQKRIESISTKRQSNIAKRKDVFIGTNMFANLSEKPIERQTPDYAQIYQERNNEFRSFIDSINNDIKSEMLEKLYQAVKNDNESVIDNAIEAAKSGASLGEISRTIRRDSQNSITIYPLRIQRGPELFEVLRGSVEKYKNNTGKSIEVTLACFGKVSEYKAREDFSIGFFQAGGFLTETLVVKNDQSAAEIISKSKSPIVVICSTDDNYLNIVPSFVKTLRDSNPSITTVLAGYPKEQIENHKKSGIDEFIYMGANVYEILVKLSTKIGVRS